jgi:hypothetical protein
LPFARQQTSGCDGKPVSIDRYEAWKKKGIKYANEAEDHIKVGLVCDIIEAYHRQEHI